MDKRADGARRRGQPDEVWERPLFTLGGHTGHTVHPIAFCEDAAWASAIARAIDALTATPSTPAPADNTAHAPGKSVGGEIE